MILKIRKSRAFKGICMMLALSIFFELVQPTAALALTGGPAQPEFSSFTPIGTSDMVDLSSGDMSYNIPLMDVGGYPLNLAYSSGIGMDDEASWVGLGWNLSVGQINRNVRGLPDDFDGDEMTYENYMKPNKTIGANFKISAAAFGVPLDLGETVSPGDITGEDDDLTMGVSAIYNNYTGFTLKSSVGISIDISKNVSIGFNAESGPDGLTISQSASIHKNIKDANKRNTKLTGSVGVSMNSRQGLTSTTLSMSKRSEYSAVKNKKGKEVARGGQGQSSLGSTIGFTDQLYTPSNRVGMHTKSITVNAALGTQMFGGEGQGQITAYGTEMAVAESEKNKKLKAYGYANTEKAGTEGVQDFNREKDGSVSVNTTNLPLTNYTYDIYSVQGQGVSGMYRPFRNQVGYVRDARTVDGSESASGGFEIGTGNAFHAGLDIEFTKVKSNSGMWSNNNYMLPQLKSNGNYAPGYEKVHYKNVGDLSADRDFNSMFTQTGSYEATRVAWNVNGKKFNRRALSMFKQKINGEGNEAELSVGNQIHRTKRQTRNQAIINVTFGQLSNGIGYGPCVSRNGSTEYAIPTYAKDHHTGEVQIIRNDGARYIYGLPSYNKTKREATFAVNNNGNCTTGLVSYEPEQVNNPESLPGDQYLDRTTTPAYVHTYLLTSILSTDYQDIANDGPTSDDFGSYTKFTYAKLSSDYKWRVPYELNMATYNEGLKTDSKDQKGNYVYGEKEQFLVNKIETKTHVAIFNYSPRKDAHGVLSESGGINIAADSYKLESVSLYSVKEFGTQNAKPIKVVHFIYDYSLCKGVPNNDQTTNLDKSELSNGGGKLTLKRIYFTYRDSQMGKYTDYEFTYSEQNPDYNIKGYDSWGNYAPNVGSCDNVGKPDASEFPYTSQDENVQNLRAESWSLKSIKLPSGGSISVNYESDDYAYVQDKLPMRMFKVAGTGFSSIGTEQEVNGQPSAELFDNPLLNKPKTYLYVEVDENEIESLDFDYIRNKYIGDLMNNPIYFRFFINMTVLGGVQGGENTGKFDYVSGYFEYEEANNNPSDNHYDGDSKIFSVNGKKYLSIPVKIVKKEGGIIPQGLINKVNPIAKAAWQFGRKYLNQHVYSMLPNGDAENPQEMIQEILTPNIFNNLIEIFTGPNATLENKNIGRRFIKEKSWIRLYNPKSKKLGGGCRVKEVRMNDVWEQMNNNAPGFQTMQYGQIYSYLLTNNKSSGVATYEPIGNKENPFVQPVFSSVNHLLAPDEDNFIEKPFGESFFPSPQVTYSRVTVSNLSGGNSPVDGMQIKKLHKTGHVVTEFYTSKDYPTIVDQTIMEAKEDKNQALANILNIYSRKHFTASQGYTIHLNDMNGKQKAQWIFAEGQSTPISGVRYLYDNHETPNNFSASSVPGRMKGRMNNEVVVLRSNGTVGRETIGVEIDFVNDFRENSTTTETFGINCNLATFFVGIIPGIVPIPLPDYSYSEDLFRSVTTTKVINTFGILKETIAYDAGASVSTRNLAWDESTGEVLLTETVDEYNDHYYTFNYPAHWYYAGMAQASLNVGFSRGFSEIAAGHYKLDLPTGYASSDFLIPGDEVHIKELNRVVWVNSVIGNQFTLIDDAGAQVFVSNDQLRVVRSGHRNLQSAGVMNVTLMRNPLIDVATGSVVSTLGPNFLMQSSGDWANWRIINSGAVEYSDAWNAACECGINNGTGLYNPYRMNAKGVWRTKSSRTYLTGRNSQANVTPRQQGFLQTYSPMYKLTSSNEWFIDLNNWTFVAEVSKYSPYGFELENKDALHRYSAAQYGYNNTFPMAVGANAKYAEIGYDGFEDYAFDGCIRNAHFNFRENIDPSIDISSKKSHTGKSSVVVKGGSRVTMTKKIDCQSESTTATP